MDCQSGQCGKGGNRAISRIMEARECQEPAMTLSHSAMTARAGAVRGGGKAVISRSGREASKTQKFGD